MAVNRMLMTVQDLREVPFGHRHPRHGLKLLHWFSTVCVEFDEDGSMELQCDPDNGDYGFHHYGNFEYLLPRWNPYFEVGNLNTLTHVGAQDLPSYVREAYGSQGNCYERNKDRIIVSLDRASRLIGEVYITEHRFGLSDFSPEGTFLLSPDIIREAGNMQLIDFLTCAGFILIMSLGASLWEGSSSSDSSLDSDDTDDDWEDYEEWDLPEGNGSTGREVPARCQYNLGEVCSGQPADQNCMNPPELLPIQNSHDWPGTFREVQKKPSFQRSKADTKSQKVLACKQFITDPNENQPGSAPKPLNQPPFQQSYLQHQLSCQLIYSDLKPQNKNLFLQPDSDSPNQMSHQEPGPNLQNKPPCVKLRSVAKCHNHLFSSLPGPHPDPQNKGYQKSPSPGVGIPKRNDCKQEIMEDTAVMHYSINVEDVVAFVVIVVVVIIMLVFRFKTLGFIIIASLCLETDCNLKRESDRSYRVLSNEVIDPLNPQDLPVLYKKTKRKKIKKWKRKLRC